MRKVAVNVICEKKHKKEVISHLWQTPLHWNLLLLLSSPTFVGEGAGGQVDKQIDRDSMGES